MKDTISEMLLKLEGLKAKKEELVKERDASKDELEKVREQLGFDLLDGGEIGKVGQAFTRAQEKVETLTSAINAIASTHSKLEKQLEETKKEKALQDIKGLGEQADSLALSLIEELKNIAIRSKELNSIEGKARSLGVGSSGFSMRHNTGRTIHQGVLMLLENMRNFDGSIQGVISQVK